MLNGHHGSGTRKRRSTRGVRSVLRAHQASASQAGPHPVHSKRAGRLHAAATVCRRAAHRTGPAFASKRSRPVLPSTSDSSTTTRARDATSTAPPPGKSAPGGCTWRAAGKARTPRPHPRATNPASPASSSRPAPRSRVGGGLPGTHDRHPRPGRTGLASGSRQRRGSPGRGPSPARVCHWVTSQAEEGVSGEGSGHRFG